MIFRLFPIILSTILFCPFPVFSASNNWQPGFRTFGLWQQKKSLRLDYNVWYPARRSPGKHSFPPWTITGSLNAKPEEGKFPLLIVSHPSAANRFFLSNLCAWLATRGFVVAIPTHAKDNLDNMENLYSWDQLKNRVTEINTILEEIIENPVFVKSVDSSNAGFIGFGAGAAAGLLLGGCLPDCGGWQSYRQGLSRASIYNRQKTIDNITAICANFPLKKSLANPVFKSIALIAPEYSFLFNQASFSYFYPQVLLVSAGYGTNQDSSRQTDYLGKLLGKKAFFLDLSEVDAAGLLDECPPALANELPELCASADSALRKKARSKLAASLNSFFYQTLIKEPKNIPPPPSLSVPGTQEQQEKPIQKQGKRKKRK